MFYYTYERKRRPMELDSLSGRPLPPPPVVSLPTDSRSARLLVAVSLDERSSFSLCFIEVLHGVSTAGPSEQKKKRTEGNDGRGNGVRLFHIFCFATVWHLWAAVTTSSHPRGGVVFIFQLYFFISFHFSMQPVSICLLFFCSENVWNRRKGWDEASILGINIAVFP